MPGARVQEKEWRECLNLLKENSGYNYAVISGSNAPGVPVDFYIEAAEIIKQKSARLIMDTSGDALKNALENGVFLIKPNLGELSSLYGVEELHPHEVIEAARSFIARGSCEVMVVSMGAGGALLVTKNEHHYVVAPAIKRKSTVGAGDSMVAGILMALNYQWNWKQVLQYGVAAGTAATMNAGTELCKKQDTDRIYKHLQH
jgi:6-phosphofructokinase 2